MAAPAADDGPQLSELESLQLKANKITDESLESTRRMINLCEEVRIVVKDKRTKSGQLFFSKTNFIMKTASKEFLPYVIPDRIGVDNFRKNYMHQRAHISHQSKRKGFYPFRINSHFYQVNF